MIDRGPPLDAEIEAELKLACALLSDGLKPKRDRPNYHDKRKLDATKHTNHRQQPQQEFIRDQEALTVPVATDHSHSALDAEPVIYHVHRDVNSCMSPQKPRKVIKDQFPKLDVPTTGISTDCSTHLRGEAQSRHASDVPSVSPHADYHQFIRNIGPRSVTDNYKMELDPKPKEANVRKSFESTGSANSIISPPVPPPMVEEILRPPRKKSNKPRLYLEQVLVPEPPVASTSLIVDGQNRRRMTENLPYVEQRPSGMAMRNCDHTFEEVRQERQSIIRPMSAQSVRPKREVPHSRSSSAVGWHEPTLNNIVTNRSHGSMYLGSTNDRSISINNRCISPLQNSRPKPAGKIDLNRALPPLPKTKENDALYPRRSSHRTHIASLIQPEHRERVAANTQPTDGQLYWQIMSRIEEIKRAPIDAPPPPKEVLPEVKPIRRPFSALGYHASLREIEYGKRSKSRTAWATEHHGKQEQQQPTSKLMRTGLPKALDPAVSLTDTRALVANKDKTPGMALSSSLRARTPSQRSNNRSERAAVKKTSSFNSENKRIIHKSSNLSSIHHQNRVNSHSSHHVHKSPNRRQYRTNPTNVADQIDSGMTELNNFLKPKVLAELGYTRRIDVENPVAWSTDGSYNGSGSYGNNSSSSGGGGGSGKISSSSNTNIIYNNNEEYRHNHAQQEGHHIAAVKRILEHVALGRMKTGTKLKSNTKFGSRKERAREEQERNITWMDRIEGQGVKGGVMILDDAAKAPVVRF